MKTTVQVKFDNVIKKGFHEILKPQGFKKKGTNFYLQLADIGQLVNIQKKSSSNSQHISFTMNIGVFEPKVWREVYDSLKTKPLPEFPTDPDCFIRRRIGELQEKNDIWYEINENTDEEILIKEMQHNVNQYVIPFFERLNSVEKISKELENIWVTPLHKIIFYAEYNELDKAKKEYNNLIHRENLNKLFLGTIERYRKKYNL